MYIDSGDKLFNYSNELLNNKTETIALDIEGESNLHSYGEKLCLVQIYDGKQAVIIDPFKVPVRLLKEILENRSIMKIMFDAAGDRAFLYKNNEIDLKSVLDLQVAVGLLDYENRDLSSVLAKALDIDSGRSKKKFQKYNWSTRPLKPEAVEYAIEDVTHLFELKDRLLSDIIKNGLIEKFILKNLQVQNKPHVYNTRPKLLREGAFKHLKKNEQIIFEKILAIREEFAKKLNFPPNLVLPNEQLFTLATGVTRIQDVKLCNRIPPGIKEQLVEQIQKSLNV